MNMKRVEWIELNKHLTRITCLDENVNRNVFQNHGFVFGNTDSNWIRYVINSPPDFWDFPSLQWNLALFNWPLIKRIKRGNETFYYVWIASVKQLHGVFKHSIGRFLQCLHNKLLEHMHNLYITDCYEILAHIAFRHIIAQMPLVMWT